MEVYKREHFVLYIWNIQPIPTIRTTIRIVLYNHGKLKLYWAIPFFTCTPPADDKPLSRG